MTTRIEATAAPTTIKLGDRTFRMSPMTDEDMGIMDQWVQSRHVRIARATLPKDASDEQRQLTESVALSQASAMSFMSGAGASLMGHPEALAMLFWCGIRRNHPDVTPEQIRELLFDRENLDALQDEWDRINLADKASEKLAVKKKARRRTAKKSRQQNR